MDNIYKTDAKYDFTKLKLQNPKGIQGGAFFSKLTFDENPVLIQTPKCFTKDGIHKTEKRIYCDLKFEDTNSEFFDWVKDLEERVQNLIYEKSTLWFHNDMDMDSIEYHWQTLLRTYKKNSHLLRSFIQKPRNFDSAKLIQIYDEQENSLTLDDIKNDTEVISILEIKGLKFTSQSFCLEFYLRQIMVLKNKPLFNKCLISLNNIKDLEKNTKHLDNSIKQTITAINDTDTTIVTSEDVNENVEEVTMEDVNEDVKDVTMEDVKDVKMEDVKENVKEVTMEDVKEVIKGDVMEVTMGDVKEVTMEDVKNNTLGETKSKNTEKKIDDFKLESNETLEKNDLLSEIDIKLPKKENSMKLKPAKEVYFEIYKAARKRAKDAKMQAIKTYLEAKKIKSTYLLDDIESSDDDLEDLAGLFS
tara:strand:+ start:312 stop:1559 length:1248 start_codon:yes stop_codon:yes gene_type:complete